MGTNLLAEPSRHCERWLEDTLHCGNRVVAVVVGLLVDSSFYLLVLSMHLVE